MLECAAGTSPYAALATPEGASLLTALSSFDEEHAAAASARARGLATPEVARAALATAFARRRAEASGKFADARSMFFTRPGYEQSTSQSIAGHRAERFTASDVVADLCCGIGSDAIALARRVGHVNGCDVDADALACAANNARAAGVEHKVTLAIADAVRFSLDGATAAFSDPSRRRGGDRVHRAAEHEPPLQALLARAHELPDGRLCVKTVPGIDLTDRAIIGAIDGLPLEAEFISERGTCKEAALWCGALARADGARRATAIGADGDVNVFEGDPRLAAPIVPIEAYVGEPDPALIRSGLIGALCVERGWGVLDRRVAYLAAGKARRGAFARWYRVRDAMPFGVKRLREYLREHAIGVLVIKTRAFPLNPDEIKTLLKPHGSGHATLICTTVQGKKTAIVCDQDL